jgi:hypothetical protein
MTKANYDDLSPADFESAEQFDDDFIPDNALPLCAKCLKPCDPLQYYCDKCDSYDAINPLTPYIGFVNIWFKYDIFCTMWSRIWGDDGTSIIVKLFYLFLIVVHAPIMVIVGVPTYLIYKIPHRQVRNGILTFYFLALIALLILYACYWRHVRIFSGVF